MHVLLVNTSHVVGKHYVVLPPLNLGYIAEAARREGHTIDVVDADSIRVILEHRRESPVALFSLDGRPHLKTVHVPLTDVTAYGALLAPEVIV